MGHYGKHIIDPKTGLCEICDRGAIFDQQAKRKQFLYSTQDGKFTYRELDASDDGRYPQDEPTPRRVRKPLYSQPPSRLAVQEEPVVQRKVPRRDRSPLDDTQHPRLTTFYYVDNTGQMVPRNGGPPGEPRQRYLVQNHHTPTSRPARHVPRRAQTPPPPASDTWRSRPKRQVNSDTKIIRQTHRSRADEFYQQHSPGRAEMYYLDKPQYENRFPTISSRVQESHNYQRDTFRKQRQLEPIERKHNTEQEPQVTRKVYKKLPENSRDERVVRKAETFRPSPRSYQSAPLVGNTYNRNNQNPSLYYLRSVDGF